MCDANSKKTLCDASTTCPITNTKTPPTTCPKNTKKIPDMEDFVRHFQQQPPAGAGGAVDKNKNKNKNNNKQIKYEEENNTKNNNKKEGEEEAVFGKWMKVDDGEGPKGPKEEEEGFW